MQETRQFGNYILLDHLGQGGMGEVWRARHQMLERLAAVKLIQAGTGLGSKDDRGSLVRRFEREARATSALKSPHTIQIYDYGVAPDGTFFYAMELLEGLDFQDLVERHGPISAERAIYLLTQVCESLDEAHQNGLVHRDIKPGNIYLCKLGLQFDFVKVLDFGLVTAAPGSSVASPTLTEAGFVPGTPAFLAPEAAKGDSEPSADIYAFGCLAYWLLTGTLVFEGATPLDVVLQHVEAEPEPLSNRTELDVPSSLEDLVMKCLRKDPAGRPPTMGRIKEELEACVGLRPWTRDQAEAWWDGHRPAQLPELDEFEALSASTTAVPIDGRADAGAAEAMALPKRKYRRRGVALVMLGILGLVLAGAAWMYERSRVRWAENVALPEIEELIAGGRFSAAVALAEKAEPYIPSDPRWTLLWPQMATTTSIRMETPEHADLYVSEVAAPAYSGARVPNEEEWKHLGQTPLQIERLPVGHYRIRFEWPGFETLEGVYFCEAVPAGESVERSLSLLPAGTVPPGLAAVEARDLRSLAYGFNGLDPIPGTEEDPAFFIGKFEVTNEAYQRFVDADGYTDPQYWQRALNAEGQSLSWEDAQALFRDQSRRPGPSSWTGGTYPEGKDDYPVSGVSWYEAVAYAQFAGATLPTVYHWYGAIDPRMVREIIATSNFGPDGAGPVGETPFGQFGIHDMAGNVREWAWNACGEHRFILGGASNDPFYTYSNGDLASPLDRSTRNGIRLANYLGLSGEDLARFLAPLPPPTSDFVWGESVSDDVFVALASQYTYDPQPLEALAEVVDVESRYWTRERVTFDAAYDDDRVLAHLFLPRGVEPPYQTVVYFPGAGTIQKSSSETLQGMDILERIIKSGRAVMYPVYWGTYERFSGQTGNGRARSRAYADQKIRWIRDVMRSVDYLDARGLSDMESLAYLGLSWGAEHGPVALVMEDRFKAGIFMDGGAILASVLPEVDESNFVSRVSVPVLMLNGSLDYIFPVELSQVPFFENLGTAEGDKRHVVYEGGHVIWNSFPDEVTKEILAWFDRYFGPVR